MKRRMFMNWVGVGLMATSLPVALAACNSSETAEAPADAADAGDAGEAASGGARDDGFTELGTVSELDSAGFLASSSFAGGSVIAVRDPNNADSVIALDSMCTHQGCTVEWADTEFACPCHQSRFSPEGAVTSGPATEDLAAYEAKIEDDFVLVKA